MTNRLRYADTEPDTGDTGVGSDHGEGRPRWVKVLGSIYIVVVLAFVILLLAGRAPEHASPWGWL